MKKLIIILLVTLMAVGAFAQNADLVFVDGWVDIKSAGETFEAFSGDTLKAGDSIITLDDSYAELEQNNLSTIFVKPNSIFTLREIETDSGRETVLSTTVGAVSFKFGKLFGKEPTIATPSVVAGIRGTELTVYAGEDGSTLIAVESGMVSVESQGVTVDLVKDEGVEVLPGEVPGEKFSLLGRELNFSSWNAEKYEALIADPVAGLGRFNSQMDDFIREIGELDVILNELKAKRDVLREEWEKIVAKDGNEKAGEFFKENISPIESKTGPLFLNIRYYSLSSLSFRRFILGKLYLDMKSRFITDTKNPEYQEFLSIYSGILEMFEERVVPYLDANDI